MKIILRSIIGTKKGSSLGDVSLDGFLLSEEGAVIYFPTFAVSSTW